MPWTAPRTWVVGELVTAAFMNTFIRDNQIYLAALTQTDATGARDIAATVYRNNGDKGLLAVITCLMEVTGGNDGISQVNAYCEVGTPPAVICGTIRMETQGAGLNDDVRSYAQLTIFVPPLYYYMCDTTIAINGVLPILGDWFEWS